MKKVILLLVLAGLAFGAWYAYKEYNRKPKNAGELEAAFKMTAEELRAAYDNEEEANKKYNTKVIEVSGTVSSATQNEKNFDVLLETEDPMTGINISIIPEDVEKAKKLQPGQSVTIKGICNGKLADIELNKGVIIQ